MMGRAPKKDRLPEPKIELRPDGWERFEKAVDAALKTPPKPRAKRNAKPPCTTLQPLDSSK
jgi:hypothetical protein